MAIRRVSELPNLESMIGNKINNASAGLTDAEKQNTLIEVSYEEGDHVYKSAYVTLQ